MTLGELLDRLSPLQGSMVVTNVCASGGSYRGYYRDFALEDGTCTVAELYKYLDDEVLDKVYSGYKGGDFEMHSGVDVYVAQYGCCGELIVGITEDGGEITLATQKEVL